MRASWNVVLTLLIAPQCMQNHVHGHQVLAETAGAPGTTNANAKRVAVIGAGAAGSSTAYYLQQFASTSGVAVNVTVFERNSYVGGRSTTVNAFNDPSEPVELGASIFVNINTILRNASTLFGLNPIRRTLPGITAIWNGKSFVYTQQAHDWSFWNFWDTAKYMWKYGLAPVETRCLKDEVIGRFLELYKPDHFPFRSLSVKAFELDLTSVTSQTGAQFLAAKNIGHPFTTDIVQSATRANYAQNLANINGLGTMVSLASDGALGIKGGNWQIFDGMLKASNTTTLLNTTINSISKSNGKYNVKSTTKDPLTQEALSKEETFDTIVLAAPYQYADIEIERGLLQHVPEEIPYVTLHVTLFTSKKTMNPLFFNLAPGDEVPTTIYTTRQYETASEESFLEPKFLSITILRKIRNPSTLEIEYLYRVFSHKKLKSSFLSKLLAAVLPEDLTTVKADGGDAITWYYPKVWEAFPYELTRDKFEESELAQDFYYTSGMESFISTMETSALMGMNVARLIVDDYSEEQAMTVAAGGEQTVIGLGTLQDMLRRKLRESH